MNPRWPVYIVSKGRWESRLTVKELERCAIPYRIVVEPTEADRYAEVIERGKLLVLPFHDLGQGSIPARNWIWEHAITEGADWHWILDDNMSPFIRIDRNREHIIQDGSTFCAIEDFVDRYTNIGQAGMQYAMFIPRRYKHTPLIWNTRIYSCILLRTDLPYRWRGRYNEDTDLSLRILKDGLCTALICAFTVYKRPTMRIKGGNTELLYQGDGRLRMAQSLQAQHPDVVKIVQKWGRWQHQVNYRPFRNNFPRIRPDYTPPTTPQEYGMKRPPPPPFR